jgi:hypothetical protein
MRHCRCCQNKERTTKIKRAVTHSESRKNPEYTTLLNITALRATIDSPKPLYGANPASRPPDTVERQTHTAIMVSMWRILIKI